MEYISDVLERHPGFRPAHGVYEDMPTNEEIWSANMIHFDEMVEQGVLVDTIVDNVVTRTKEEKYQDMCAKYGHTGPVSNESENERYDRLGKDLDRRTQLAGVPPLFLRSPHIDRTYDDVMESGGGLYVFGAQGSGKTTLACSVLRSWLGRHHTGAKFTEATMMLMALRDTYDNRQSMRDLTESYVEIPLLVIDDLDKVNPTADALMFMESVVDLRGKYLKPTIVTTQYDVGDLMSLLSSRGGVNFASAMASRFSAYAKRYMGNVDNRVA